MRTDRIETYPMFCFCGSLTHRRRLVVRLFVLLLSCGWLLTAAADNASEARQEPGSTVKAGAQVTAPMSQRKPAATQKSRSKEARRAEQERQAQKKKEQIELLVDERVMVIGDAARVRDIPGSAHLLSRADMERQNQIFDDVHRYLRQVPGINIQEEDGFGLRPNIGLRGSGSERSSKITLMEDGVLIAPAPYAASSAYYFPTAGRMEAIEVRKGSSQVKYGPRTNGGALNLVSTSIPQQFDLRARLSVGDHGTARALVNVGHSGQRYGWLLETYQISSGGFKKLDGGGDTGYELQDYLLKFGVNSDPSASIYQDLEVKLGKTKQVSDETYLGLTDEDFRAHPLRRYAGSQEDVFRSDHEQYQVRHFVGLTPEIDVTTVAYRNDFSRNWYKLQSINGVNLSAMLEDTEEFAGELAIARGASSGADAMKVRANARTYYGRGVQSVVGWRPQIGAARNQFEFGIRYHEDQEDRFQHEDGFRMVDGTMLLTSAGRPGSQSNRVSDARAWAFFVQDQIDWGRWSFNPGVRIEAIELVRTDYAKDDPQRDAPTRVRINDLTIVVPGIGVGYDVSSELRLFGGVHKGFGPPGPGSSDFTEAEKSVNYEAGMRDAGGALGLDITGFFNDYSNLLGADTLSSGGTGSGDLFNGGDVDVIGIEAATRFSGLQFDDWSVMVPVWATYTYTDATFQRSFVSSYAPWGHVEIGDKLPYLSAHQFAAGIGVARGSFSIDLEAVYNSTMRTDASQGSIDPLRSTDSFLVWNLSANVTLADQVAVFAGIENLTNDVYIVARRPAGARPALPRTLVAGLKLDF
ncbi:MAG: TonB-dependent receptor [Acidobacteria bacterium]|nr:TonB-dependent receptor [Acidobacteriota bacterium]